MTATSPGFLSTRTTVSDTGRLYWLDMAKGYAIILVVIGHTLRGLMEEGILAKDGIWSWVDNAIYSFHMPLFFALSAYLFGQKHVAAPVWREIHRRVSRLAVPFLIWTYVFLALRSLAGYLFGDGEMNWAALLQLPLPPVLHMWFLWVLMVLSTVWLLCTPFERRDAHAQPLVVPGALFIASTALFLGNVPISPGIAPYVASAIYNAPAFFLGILIARLAELPRSRAAIGISTTLIFLLPAIWSLWTPHKAALVPVLAILIIAHFVAFRAMGGRDRHVLPWRFLILTGQASLAIFVAHTIFSAGLRIVLVSQGVVAPGPHLILGILVGIAGPLGLLWVARRAGIARAVGLA